MEWKVKGMDESSKDSYHFGWWCTTWAYQLLKYRPVEQHSESSNAFLCQKMLLAEKAINNRFWKTFYEAQISILGENIEWKDRNAKLLATKS